MAIFTILKFYAFSSLFWLTNAACNFNPKTTLSAISFEPTNQNQYFFGQSLLKKSLTNNPTYDFNYQLSPNMNVNSAQPNISSILASSKMDHFPELHVANPTSPATLKEISKKGKQSAPASEAAKTVQSANGNQRSITSCFTTSQDRPTMSTRGSGPHLTTSLSNEKRIPPNKKALTLVQKKRTEGTANNRDESAATDSGMEDESVPAGLKTHLHPNRVEGEMITHHQSTSTRSMASLSEKLTTPTEVTKGYESESTNRVISDEEKAWAMDSLLTFSETALNRYLTIGGNILRNLEEEHSPLGVFIADKSQEQLLEIIDNMATVISARMDKSVQGNATNPPSQSAESLESTVTSSNRQPTSTILPSTHRTGVIRVTDCSTYGKRSETSRSPTTSPQDEEVTTPRVTSSTAATVETSAKKQKHNNNLPPAANVITSLASQFQAASTPTEATKSLESELEQMMKGSGVVYRPPPSELENFVTVGGMSFDIHTPASQEDAIRKLARTDPMAMSLTSATCLYISGLRPLRGHTGIVSDILGFLA